MLDFLKTNKELVQINSILVEINSLFVLQKSAIHISGIAIEDYFSLHDITMTINDR